MEIFERKKKKKCLPLFHQPTCVQKCLLLFSTLNFNTIARMQYLLVSQCV